MLLLRFVVNVFLLFFFALLHKSNNADLHTFFFHLACFNSARFFSFYVFIESLSLISILLRAVLFMVGCAHFSPTLSLFLPCPGHGRDRDHERGSEVYLVILFYYFSSALPSQSLAGLGSQRRRRRFDLVELLHTIA